MATNFVIGKGTAFSISVDGGTTFIPVPQIKALTFSGSKSDLEDITNMNSIGAFREYAPTLLDSGQVSFNGVFDPVGTGQTALHGAFTAQTLVFCKLQFPKASDQTATGFLRTFTAYVSEFNIDAQFDKASTLSGVLKITGPTNDTPGS